MALLIERHALGRSDGIIAADLSDKMSAIEAEQKFPLDDGVFELHRFRLWINEYSALASRGAEIGGIATAERAVETRAGPVATRLYNPDGQDATLVFVHGGGWVMGGVKTHDHIARWLASETGSRVLQLEYSLAPERPYPAAVNEVMGVVSATLAEARAAPVLVAGDLRAPISRPPPFSGCQKRRGAESRASSRSTAPMRRK